MAQNSRWKIIILIAIVIVTASGVACPTGASLIPYCATCTVSGANVICSSCINGYYLASPNCISCASALSNCVYCSLNLASQLICSVCAANYGILSNSCQTCSAISGCGNCSVVQNILQCVQCSSNLVLYSAQTKCVPCQITNCTSCSVSNDGVFSCSVCALGYYLSGNVCLQCGSAIQYCTSCLYDQNNKLLCAACASTLLYLDSNKCVTNCSLSGKPECAVCELSSLSGGIVTCSSCKQSYFFDTATKTCKSCAAASPGCSNCTILTSADSSVTSCLACASGYFLSGNPAVCVACSTVNANCAECSISFASGSGQCTKCKDGFYLNSTDFVCYSCSNSPFLTSSFAAGTCAVCSVSGLTLICAKCTEKYYFSSSVCVSCGTLLPNCATCSSSTVCLACVSGYSLSSGSCVLCNTVFANCLYCNSVECTDCRVGYYTTDNKNCVSSCLVSNCYSCVQNNNQQCSICKQGYTMSGGQCAIMQCSGQLQFNGLECVCPIAMYNNNGVCTACLDENCLYCPANVCKTCFRGYYQSNGGGLCLSCPSNCHICASADRCLLCNQGYYFSGSQCMLISSITTVTKVGLLLSSNLYQLCGFGCLSCSTSQVCLSCGRGFYLNNSICLQCGQNCGACKMISTVINSTVTTNNVSSNVTSTVYSLQCVFCNAGSALFDNSCLACYDPNCISCDFNTQFCIECQVKYTPNKTGSCLPCAANCDFCDSAGPGACDAYSCSVGYTRYNSTGCLPCKLGCPSCESVFPFNCIGCLIGTYNESKSSNCESCPLGCSACSSATTCTTCIDYYVLSAGSCKQYCQLPCLACTWSNGVQICSSCLRGYSLTNGTCVGSFGCVAQSICEFCPLGYFAYRGVCYECMPNCASCQFLPSDPAFVIAGTNYLSYLNCSYCGKGYFMSPTARICTLCDANCAFCDSKKNCLRCSDGYFLERRNYNMQVSGAASVGMCQKCLSLCQTCSLSPNRCTSCVASFKLTGFKCTGLVNVSFSINLAVPTTTSVTELSANYQQIMNAIYASFGSLFVSNPELVTILSFQQASLIINGVASMSSQGDSSATYRGMDDGMKNTKSMGPYTVSSYSLQAQGFTPSDSSSSTGAATIGIIVGGAIGGVALVVIIAICLVRRNNGETAPSSKEETQTQTESATSNGILKPSQGVSKQMEPGEESKSRRVSKREVSHISHTQSKHSVVGSGASKPVVENSRHPSKSPVKSIQGRQETKFEDNRSSHVPPSRSRRVYEQSRSRQPYEEMDKNVDHRPKTTKLIPESNFVPRSQHRSARQIEEQQEEEYQYQERSRNRQADYIENESNMTKPQRSHPDKQQSKKRRGDSLQRRYVPNKNTYFI